MAKEELEEAEEERPGAMETGGVRREVMMMMRMAVVVMGAEPRGMAMVSVMDNCGWSEEVEVL